MEILGTEIGGADEQGVKNFLQILYDGPLSPTPRSGIERYFTMLITNLPDNARFSCSVPCPRERMQIGEHNVASPPIPLFRPRTLSGLLNKFCWMGKGFDVVHWIQYGSSQIAGRLRNKGVPFVVTVHDLIHEIHGAPGELLDRSARQASYDHASAIICVSENTQEDLLREYEVDPHKTHVIHHGSSISTSEVKREGQTNGAPYFLYIGPRSGYKNFKKHI